MPVFLAAPLAILLQFAALKNKAMKGFALYRILTLLVNVICTIFGMNLVVGLAFVFVQPQMLLLPFLIMLAVILYAWHANRFLLKVLIKKEVSTRKHKDWLQVNAIVTVAFCIFFSGGAIYLLNHQELIKAENLPDKYPAAFFVNSIKALIGVCVILFSHVVWTYILVREHRDYFSDDNL